MFVRIISVLGVTASLVMAYSFPGEPFLASFFFFLMALLFSIPFYKKRGAFFFFIYSLLLAHYLFRQYYGVPLLPFQKILVIALMVVSIALALRPVSTSQK